MITFTRRNQAFKHHSVTCKLLSKVESKFQPAALFPFVFSFPVLQNGHAIYVGVSFRAPSSR